MYYVLTVVDDDVESANSLAILSCIQILTALAVSVKTPVALQPKWWHSAMQPCTPLLLSVQWRQPCMKKGFLLPFTDLTEATLKKYPLHWRPPQWAI
jgi:hypothetical protein